MSKEDNKPNYFILEDDYDDCHYDTVDEICESNDTNEVYTFIPVYEGACQFAVQAGKPGTWDAGDKYFKEFVTTTFQTLAEAEAFAKNASELQQKLEEAPDVEPAGIETGQPAEVTA